MKLWYFDLNWDWDGVWLVLFDRTRLNWVRFRFFKCEFEFAPYKGSCHLEFDFAVLGLGLSVTKFSKNFRESRLATTMDEAMAQHRAAQEPPQ